MSERLRLRAVYDVVLAVLAACMQDALVTVADMSWRAEEQRFILVANRFKWEATRAAATPFLRTLSGLTIEGVTAARRQGIDPQNPEAILSLLTLRPVDGAIELTFAGGRALRLETPEIRVRLEDFGEEWPALWRPRHER